MKTTLRFSLLLLGLTALAFTAHGQVQANGTVAQPGDGQDVQSASAISARLQNYSFPQRAEFAVLVKSLRAKSEAAWSALNANYDEMLVSPARRSAMKTLRSRQEAFNRQVALLDNVEVETWDNAKGNIINAWERVEDALQRVRAEKN